MESDLASLLLETADTTGAETLSTGRVMSDQLRNSEAVGRLVIDLDQLLVKASIGDMLDNMQRKDSDRLMVPTHSQLVTVIGETQQNTSHLFQPGHSREGYTDLSDGLTRRADRRLIDVV